MYESLLYGIGLMVLIYLNAVSSKSNVGLYEETDRLTIFNGTSYKKIMENGLETNWFIEYYNSFCGHCINFAPIFKNFAADVYDWRDTVKVGVLDCRLYGSICRKIVHYYPTLMFYRAGYNESMGQELKNRRTVYDLKRSLMKSVKFETFLQPRTEKTLASLAEGSIVIADTDGMLAQEILLDLRHLKKPLFWVKGKFVDGHISSISNPKKTTVDLLIVKKGRLEVLKSHILSRASARRAVESAWGEIVENAIEQPASKSETKESLESIEKKFTLQMVNKFPHFEDIHSSIVIAFRQDVPLHDIIDGHKMDALKNMLSVIREYLSFMSSYAKSSYRTTFNIIATMYSILENQVKNLSHISGNEWKEKFDAAVLLPKTEDWDCCTGSKPFYRGYPCGLWTMFHSLTVMDCLKQPTATGDRARFVIRAVRDFVTNFFSCKECATNFALETKNLDEHVNSPCEAVIWLWRIHNNVNRRLAGKPSEDPEFPKVQFPTPQLCPTCARRTEGTSASQPGAWNEEEIGRFLKIFFHPNNLRMKRNSKFKNFVENLSLDSDFKEIEIHNGRRGGLNKVVISRFPNRFNGGKRQSTDLILCALISLMTTGVAFYIFLMFYKNRYRYRHSSQSKTPKRIP